MRHCARKSWRWSFCTARSNIVLFFQSFFKDSPFKRFAFLKADVSTFCELYVLRFFPIIWQYAQHIFIVIGDNALLADRERDCIDKKYTYKIYTKDHLTIVQNHIMLCVMSSRNLFVILLSFKSRSESSSDHPKVVWRSSQGWFKIISNHSMFEIVLRIIPRHSKIAVQRHFVQL